MHRPRVEHPGALHWGVVVLSVGLVVLGVAVSLGRTHPVLALVFGWAGLSAVSASVLYLVAALGGHPGAVLKGRRWTMLQALFLPFRTVSWGVYLVAQWTGHARVACEIVPGLYVGPRPLGAHGPTLTHARISAVLDLAAELPSTPFAGPSIARLEVPVLDRTGPSDADLDAAVAWVRARMQPEAPVLVHCAFGRGRSGLVATAVVLAQGLADSPEGAIALVTHARPSVRVDGDQRESLRRFHTRRRMG